MFIGNSIIFNACKVLSFFLSSIQSIQVAIQVLDANQEAIQQFLQLIPLLEPGFFAATPCQEAIPVLRHSMLSCLNFYHVSMQGLLPPSRRLSLVYCLNSRSNIMHVLYPKNYTLCLSTSHSWSLPGAVSRRCGCIKSPYYRVLHARNQRLLLVLGTSKFFLYIYSFIFWNQCTMITYDGTSFEKFISPFFVITYNEKPSSFGSYFHYSLGTSDLGTSCLKLRHTASYLLSWYVSLGKYSF
jgi:hypothetical protein